MKSYKYQRLDEACLTRVLRLEPSANPNAPLRCTLQQWQPSDSPYEAVSYVWGDPALVKTLLCDNNKDLVLITRSLDILLRALRNPSEARTLWVDAVCINQSDLVERAKQVRRMPKIYRQASNVVLWVGQDFDNGSDVLRLLSKHEQDLQILATRIAPEDNNRTWVRRREGSAREIENADRVVRDVVRHNLASFESFFRRSWFQRRWIVQEAILARKAHVQCGDATMELMAFVTTTLALRDNCIAQSVYSQTPSSYPDDYVFSMLESVGRDHSRQNHLQGTILGPRHLILDLLSDFHAAGCLDGRDRIYSMLGLSENLQSLEDDTNTPWTRTDSFSRSLQMPISYENSVQDVYIDFASNLMRTRTNTSEMLHFAGAFRSPHDTHLEPGLPSWVPDWRRSRRFIPWNGPSYTVRPSRDKKEEHQWAVTSKELVLWGFTIGTVGAKLDADTESEANWNQRLRKEIQKWLLFYVSDSSQDPPKTKPPAGEVPRSTEWLYFFFRCVSMDRREWKTGQARPADDFVDFIFDKTLQRVPVRGGEGKAGYVDWKLIPGKTLHRDQRLTSHEETAGESEADERGERKVLSSSAKARDSSPRLWSGLYTVDLLDFMKGRCLCKDDKGEVSNCPNDAEVGDIYAVFYSFNSPFVLRRVPKLRSKGPIGVTSEPLSQDDDACRYTLIGNCFTRGMAESTLGFDGWLGQCFQESAKKEPQKFIII